MEKVQRKREHFAVAASLVGLMMVVGGIMAEGAIVNARYRDNQGVSSEETCAKTAAQSSRNHSYKTDIHVPNCK